MYRKNRKSMICEESDWLGILSTVILTAIISVTPIPESKWLSVPVAFGELYALLLLVFNYYFVLYVTPLLSQSTIGVVAVWIPFVVFIIASILVWVKTYLFGLIAFFVSSSITSTYGAAWSLSVAGVISVVISFSVRKLLYTKLAEEIFMYIVNAVLLVFSVLAIERGKPGTIRNKEPPNFYVICNPDYGTVTVIDNIIHMALLLVYIGLVVLFRVIVVRCYNRCEDNKIEMLAEEERRKIREASKKEEKHPLKAEKKYEKIYQEDGGPNEEDDNVVIELGPLDGNDDSGGDNELGNGRDHTE
jgi:hypothetical protein